MKNKPLRIYLFGNAALIVFLSFLSAFAPLSTDMYLPALPAMSQTFGVDNDITSYTVSLFLLVFALSMPVWGPLSDKLGRKPVLAAGSVIYVISSAAIALSGNIWTLLFWRCLQALGSGAASTISLAIVKDILRGNSMEKIVSIMQTFIIIAPLTAPVIGGWLLLFLDWRGIFWCLAGCGLIAILGALPLRETANKNQAGTLLATFKNMGVVLAQKKFLYSLLIFSSMSMPFMAYLALSSFIFQNEFGLDAQQYSLFFAFNASFSLAGPFAHFKFLRRFGRNKMLALYIGCAGLAGLTILFLGNAGPWPFALLAAMVSFFGSALRPPSTVLMMECIEGNNGIVASLINCGGLLFGSLSMFIASLSFWPNSITAIGCITIMVCAIALGCWLRVKKYF